MAISGSRVVSTSNAKYEISYLISSISGYEIKILYILSYYVSSTFTGSRSFPYSVTIDGVTYSGTGTITSPTATGYKSIWSKVVDTTYDLDGTKVVPYSFTTSYNNVTATGSGSFTLPKCERYPLLNGLDGGTLGVSESLGISYSRSGHTYELTYETVYDSGTIVSGKTDGSNISWTPPISLVEPYTNRSSISITVTLKTYYDGAVVATDNATATYSLPSTYYPDISATVSDLLGHVAKYGAYVQGQSKVGVDITAAGKYGATISSYRAVIDGVTYTGASVESNVLTSAGTLTVTAYATDSRGQTSSKQFTISVLAYEFPKVTEITAMRSDANGNYLPSGGYYKVTFDAAITALNSKNSANYVLRYKKTSETTFTETAISGYAGNYSISGGYIIISASSSSAYDLVIVATDDFGNHTRQTTGVSGSKLFSILTKGVGFAFNKIAELENVLDIGFKTKFTGGIMPNTLPNGTNFDDLKMQNIYVGDTGTGGYINCPVASGGISLEVKEIGLDGLILQRIEHVETRARNTYERSFDGSWNSWKLSNKRIIMPDGYTAINYLASSGTQYIDTGFTPNANTRLKMVVRHTGSAGEYLFGSVSAWDGTVYALYCTGTTFRSDYGASQITLSGVNVQARNEIDFDKNACTIDSVSVTHLSQTLESYMRNTLTLFAYIKTIGNTTTNYFAAMELYSCQIYDNGTLVRDFTPCTNSSGALGLYDWANNQFYTNAGTGSFTGA